MTLKDLDLEVRKGEFIIIIGKIGSGKTSLLQALLNEMTYVPQNEIDRLGGSVAELTSENINEVRQNIYQPKIQFEGGAPIKIDG